MDIIKSTLWWIFKTESSFNRWTTEPYTTLVSLMKTILTIWKPKDFIWCQFGNNGFYLDFEDSSSLGNDVQ